jgi:hypothetical protein
MTVNYQLLIVNRPNSSSIVICPSFVFRKMKVKLHNLSTASRFR